MIELHQADALEVLRSLPAGLADAIVTDPPYCSGAFLEAARGAVLGQGLRAEGLRSGDVSWFVGDNMTTGGLTWLLRGVAVEAVRVLKPSGHLVVFCDWRMIPALAPAMESAGLRWRSLLVWDKKAIGLGQGFRPRHEVALHYTHRKPEFHSKRVANVLSHGRVAPRSRRHSCEKPAGLLADIVEVVSPPDGCLIDPFAGSGSLADVGLAMGRYVILAERDPAAFQALCRRFAGAANDNKETARETRAASNL